MNNFIIYFGRVLMLNIANKILVTKDIKDNRQLIAYLLFYSLNLYQLLSEIN